MKRGGFLKEHIRSLQMAWPKTVSDHESSSTQSRQVSLDTPMGKWQQFLFTQVKVLLTCLSLGSQSRSPCLDARNSGDTQLANKSKRASSQSPSPTIFTCQSVCNFSFWMHAKLPSPIPWLLPHQFLQNTLRLPLKKIQVMSDATCLTRSVSCMEYITHIPQTAQTSDSFPGNAWGHDQV